MNGAELRGIRQSLGLSQPELVAELNRRLGRSYDKPKLSRWENNRESIPVDVAGEIRRMAEMQPRQARVIVLANQKGGVGKTTTSLNLAFALSRADRRVLLIDMDPQATATVGLLADAAVEAYRQGRTMTQVVLQNRPLSEVIIRAGEELALGRSTFFDLAASHIDLAEADGRREPGFDAALREAIEEVRNRYDFIVVDAPPHLGVLTWMALAAANDVIVPVRTEPYDTMGVGLILNTVNKVQRRLNPALRMAGVLPTQYGRRKSVDREVLAHLVESLGTRVPVLAAVPDSAVFGHAARNGRIALEASPNSAATQVYGRLAQALIDGASLPLADVDTAEQEA